MNNQKIPESFQLFGKVVNVLFDNKKLRKKKVIGLSDLIESTITLTTELKGVSLPEDVIIDTYYHEKVHIILDSMSRYKLSRDEGFVEVFSKLLRESESSAKFSKTEGGIRLKESPRADIRNTLKPMTAAPKDGSKIFALWEDSSGLIGKEIYWKVSKEQSDFSITPSWAYFDSELFSDIVISENALLGFIDI